MYGFKPGAKPQEKAPQGKKIEGPGNGTSDSIKTEIPKGSYIMPADSTQQIGPKALGELGQPVPVNVSNGEYQMPPEQVHAVGVQALNKMRDATHMPVAAGFKPQKDGLYFADGGLIADAAQYWANDNEQFEAGNPSFGSRVVRALNPATSFGSAMGAMHTAAGSGDKTGMALAAAQAVPVFGAMRSVITPAMGAVKAARAMAPSAAQTGAAIAGSGAAGAMADAYGSPAVAAEPQQSSAAFSDMQREPNIPRREEPRLGFADGGSPAEEERKRLAGAGPSPQMGAVALGNERRAERMSGEGMYGKANADVGGALNYLNRGDPVKDAASAIGGFFARSSDQARMADYGNTGAPSPIAATPAAAPTPPAAVGATELPSTKGRTDYGFTPDPGQGPAPGMSVRPTSSEGINRIDNAPGLKSPLFTNLPTGEAISGMQGGTVNTVPALRAPAATQQAPQPAGFQPPQQQSPAVGMIGNSDAARREREALVRAASTPHRGAQSGQLTANQLRTLAGLQEGDQRAATEAANQQAATERAAMQEAGANSRALSRDEIDRRRADTESVLKGFEARGLERAEKLYAAYETAKTPEERAAAAEQLRALSGKEAPNRFTVVPGGQEIDPTTNMAVTRPARVFNNQTGQFVDQQGAPGASAAPRPGEVRGGYRFKGGNPADQASWEKV
ncbi:MAG: hypothetical protein ACRCTX_04915 [Afipia sp.]